MYLFPLASTSSHDVGVWGCPVACSVSLRPGLTVTANKAQRLPQPLGTDIGTLVNLHLQQAVVSLIVLLHSLTLASLSVKWSAQSFFPQRRGEEWVSLGSWEEVDTLLGTGKQAPLGGVRLGSPRGCHFSSQA